MSYLEPQRWGDIDFRGNALDWNTRKGKLLYPGYEMLRLALVERCQAAEQAVPAVLSTARAPGRIYAGGWFSSFHSAISSLITNFVNHTDNGGNWSGSDSADIAPFWTEADILAKIGDPARIPAPDIPLAAWSLQQYKILNELLWTRQIPAGGVLPKETRQASAGFTVDWATTWANAVADYAVKTWGASTAFTQNQSTGNKSTVGAGGARGTRWRMKYQISKTNVFTADVDWYTYMTKIVGIPVQDINVFDDEGLGFNENKWWLFEAGTGYAGPIGVSSFPAASRHNIMPPEPVDPAVNASHNGWETRSSGAVLKWDVRVGGFKFLDR